MDCVGVYSNRNVRIAVADIEDRRYYDNIKQDVKNRVSDTAEKYIFYSGESNVSFMDFYSPHDVKCTVVTTDLSHDNSGDSDLIVADIDLAVTFKISSPFDRGVNPSIMMTGFWPRLFNSVVTDGQSWSKQLSNGTGEQSLSSEEVDSINPDSTVPTSVFVPQNAPLSITYIFNSLDPRIVEAGDTKHVESSDYYYLLVEAMSELILRTLIEIPLNQKLSSPALYFSTLLSTEIEYIGVGKTCSSQLAYNFYRYMVVTKVQLNHQLGDVKVYSIDRVGDLFLERIYARLRSDEMQKLVSEAIQKDPGPEIYIEREHSIFIPMFPTSSPTYIPTVLPTSSFGRVTPSLPTSSFGHVPPLVTASPIWRTVQPTPPPQGFQLSTAGPSWMCNEFKSIHSPTISPQMFTPTYRPHSPHMFTPTYRPTLSQPTDLPPMQSKPNFLYKDFLVTFATFVCMCALICCVVRRVRRSHGQRQNNQQQDNQRQNEQRQNDIENNADGDTCRDSDSTNSW